MAARGLLNVLWYFATCTMVVRGIPQINTDPSPSLLYVNETKQLQIHCHLMGSMEGVASVSMIKLSFNKTSSNLKELARVTASGASITDTAMREKAEVSGEIFTNLGSYLTLTLNKDISCSESGFYVCFLYLTDTNGTSREEASMTEVPGRSNPSWREIIHTPLKDKYPVGDSVEIECRGAVGKPYGNWTWQMWDKEEELWLPYKEDIRDDPPVMISDCNYMRSTFLTYRIQDEEEKKFRCMLNYDALLVAETSINGVISGASYKTFSSFLVVLCLYIATAVRTR